MSRKSSRKSSCPSFTEADFDRLLKQFLKQHPEYIEYYRVLPDGEEQINTKLGRAFDWWMRKKGHVTADIAMRLETMNREIDHGQHPWITRREHGGMI